jgi:hypothetical protein
MAPVSQSSQKLDFGGEGIIFLPFAKGGWEGFKKAIFYVIPNSNPG